MLLIPGWSISKASLGVSTCLTCLLGSPGLALFARPCKHTSKLDKLASQKGNCTGVEKSGGERRRAPYSFRRGPRPSLRDAGGRWGTLQRCEEAQLPITHPNRVMPRC
ncbi:hypothetical protein B0J12DRAFT_361068 [Macrophomina phaseolina]|uniref:Secreted protein n=1 Tax=Macrophomina phaseolina TaxID=35725 RepID=A0ABQ8FWP2_9PEZI|nr:hypothetical protein B0J12DRAFT_361068 [Macrophomina phaseolina]